MILEIADKIQLKAVQSKPRKGDIKHSFADVLKARGKLEYDPGFLLREGWEGYGSCMLIFVSLFS